MNANSALLTRIEMIERELAELKSKVQQSEIETPPVTLRGIWKGMDVTAQDFEDTKRSLFPGLDDI